jgi:hypothetical protein
MPVPSPIQNLRPNFFGTHYIFEYHTSIQWCSKLSLHFIRSHKPVINYALGTFHSIIINHILIPVICYNINPKLPILNVSITIIHIYVFFRIIINNFSLKGISSFWPIKWLFSIATFFFPNLVILLFCL